MKLLKTSLLQIAALATCALPALAGDSMTVGKNVVEKPVCESPFYLDISAGGEFDTGITDFLGDGRSANFARGIPGGFNPIFIPGTVQARNFGETHYVGINGRIELGYKVLPYLSVFGGFGYTYADGNDRANVGTVLIPTVPVSRHDLFADVGRYEAFALRAGVRLNTPRTILDLLHIPKAIRPYAKLLLGGKYLDSQEIRFYTPGPASFVNTGNVGLYDAGWVFTVEGSLGYDLALTRHVDLILESGYGYDSEPNGSHGTPNGLALSDKGSRVYSNVNFGLKIKF